jgi:hypothetical protein
MSEMERKSPFQEVKMLKLNQFGPLPSIEENIQLSFGRLSTPITWVMKPIKPRVLIKILDSKLTKSSTSDLRCQCKESWNVLEQITSFKRDGSITEPLRDGYLIQFPRQSETETGLPMYSQWKVLILDADP